MATFYVLPPRECLEQAVADFVGRLIPGLDPPASVFEGLLTSLAAAAADVYFVHREELTGADPVADELAAGFGAEPGDAVVEVGLVAASRPAAVRRWPMPAAVPDLAPAR